MKFTDKTQNMPNAVSVVRAKTLLTLADEKPSRGKALFAPLKKIDNGVLVVRNGMVESALPWAARNLPAGAHVIDAGPVCLAPGCCNAHTHLNLSHLAGRTARFKGFAAWLKSLIPLLVEPVTPVAHRLALQKACADMADAGTSHAGDFCGRIFVQPGPEATDKAGRVNGIGIFHFCEWLGFEQTVFKTEEDFWPAHCRPTLFRRDIQTHSAPCAHALYSTAAHILRGLRHFCARQGRVFAFHLAESPEEEQMLGNGHGPLRELYAERILPKNWRAPGLRPLAYAEELGLLGPGVLAIHGIHLNGEEAAQLATSGTALCLCPRSNKNLGLGLPPVSVFMESGVLLCLGTDGLTSNDDLDVRTEAVYLRETLDIPAEALVRLLTVNGAAALGLKNAGKLTPGSAAKFCVLPESLA